MIAPSSQWSLALDAAQWVTTCAVGWYVWMSRREAVNRAVIAEMAARNESRFDAIDSRIVTLDSHRAYTPTQRECSAQMARVSAIEKQLETVPTHDAFVRVHERVDGLNEAISEMRGGLKRIERTMDMISQYLMDHPHGSSKP